MKKTSYSLEKRSLFKLEKDIGVNLGEKGIVRSYSPISTLGGVEVLTVSKENARRKDSEYINFLNKIHIDDLENLINIKN